MGERSLRRLLIIGASAVARWAARKGVPAGSWLGRMLARKPPTTGHTAPEDFSCSSRGVHTCRIDHRLSITFHAVCPPASRNNTVSRETAGSSGTPFGSNFVRLSDPCETQKDRRHPRERHADCPPEEV